MLIDVKIQDDKNTGRRRLRNSLQGHQYQNRLSSRHQKNEAEIHKLERMHRATRDKIPQKTQPLQHNKTKISAPRVLIALHGLRIPRLQHLRGLLEDERRRKEIHIKINQVPHLLLQKHDLPDRQWPRQHA